MTPSTSPTSSSRSCARRPATRLLDRYERQRRHVALQHTQAETIRNKRVLAEKDPAVRRKNHEQLRRTSEDPKLARAFLLRTSLLKACARPSRSPEAVRHGWRLARRLLS